MSKPTCSVCGKKIKPKDARISWFKARATVTTERGSVHLKCLTTKGTA